MKKFAILIIAGLVMAGCTPRNDVLGEQTSKPLAVLCYKMPDEEYDCLVNEIFEGKTLAEMIYELDSAVDRFWLSVEYIDNFPVITSVKDLYPNSEAGEHWVLWLEGSDIADVNIDTYKVNESEVWYLNMAYPENYE